MEKVSTHVYEPEEEPEGEFINCKWCGKPVGLHERMRVGENDQGIYPKYVVFKHPKEETTGYQGVYMSRAGIPKHMDLVDDFCFVLKPIKDKHARIAMAAYAESIKDEKPQLARDIYEVLGDYW